MHNENDVREYVRNTLRIPQNLKGYSLVVTGIMVYLDNPIEKRPYKIISQKYYYMVSEREIERNIRTAKIFSCCYGGASELFPKFSLRMPSNTEYLAGIAEELRIREKGSEFVHA